MISVFWAIMLLVQVKMVHYLQPKCNSYIFSKIILNCAKFISSFIIIFLIGVATNINKNQYICFTISNGNIYAGKCNEIFIDFV